MSKRSQYQAAKQRERAQTLADEQGLPFAQALEMVIDRQKSATRLLKGMGKLERDTPRPFTTRDVLDTPFERLHEQIHGATVAPETASAGRKKSR